MSSDHHRRQSQINRLVNCNLHSLLFNKFTKVDFTLLKRNSHFFPQIKYPLSFPKFFNQQSKMSMWWDLSLQALIFLIGGFMYLWMNDIPRKLQAKYFTYRDRHNHQARRHFVKAAEYLSQSRSNPNPNPNDYLSLAVQEADLAVKLNPTDAANHIIKALALELQDFKTSALDSINAALSPLAVKSLTSEEKADAMVKRSQLRMEVSRLGESVDESVWESVEVELRKAFEMRPGSGRAWCLLGQCCEGLGKREKAVEAFQEAVKIDPDSVGAKSGLNRLVAG